MSDGDKKTIVLIASRLDNTKNANMKNAFQIMPRPVRLASSDLASSMPVKGCGATETT
ncbi:hypothetical protein [Burkholderia gladioli]|uniref:hypothetical protein n=1 Tax=Burkholderia gladioli TaxID=28095 RepID=UPI0034DAF869